jgi:hypothetical protein
MISRETMRGLLARVQLMKFFPSDPAVLAALGAELNGLCDDDESARCLVEKLVSDHREWPGVYVVQEIAHMQRARRHSAQQIRDGEARRDAHESSCLGFVVNIHEADRALSVERCRQRFPGSRDSEFVCRRGEEISSEVLAAREAEELAKRGDGWQHLEDYPITRRAE